MDKKRKIELEQESQNLVAEMNTARQIISACETRFIEIRGIFKEIANEENEEADKSNKKKK